MNDYEQRLQAVNKKLQRPMHLIEAIPLFEEQHRIQRLLTELARFTTPWNYVPPSTIPGA